MTTTAQYASYPKNSVTQISTANTNRDGTGTLGVVCTAGAAATGGLRIDALVIQASTTTTAGMVRLYITKGVPGQAVVSISAATTTATCTTALNHGLSTGNLVTFMGFLPDEYNVTDAAVTVTSATTFTFPMAASPTTSAIGTMGTYCSSASTPTTRLLREVLVTALTPSATVQGFSSQMLTGSTADKGYMPLILQPGWSLRASTEKAETFNIHPTFSGNFA